MDYIIKLDEDTIVWWDEECYEKLDGDRELLFSGNTQQCQEFINKINKNERCTNAAIQPIQETNPRGENMVHNYNGDDTIGNVDTIRK